MLIIETVKSQPASTTKSRLEDWQIEDAARLRRLFKTHTKLSQAAFGDRHGIGTQGMVWQYLNGKRALNPKAAKAFADGLKVGVQEISPKLAAAIEMLTADSRQSPDTAGLLEAWVGMEDDQREQLLEYATFLKARQKKS